MKYKGRIVKFTVTAVLLFFFLLPAKSVFAEGEEEMAESYRKRDFVQMYEDEELGIPASINTGIAKKDIDGNLVPEPGDEKYLPWWTEDMRSEEVGETTDAGLYLSASEDAMNQAYVTLKKIYDFSEKPVDRVTLDVWLIRGENVEARIYLDDAKSPVTTIPLRKKEAFLTMDLSSLDIQGQHRVSVRFTGSGEGDEGDKQIKVLVSSIGFEYYSVPIIYFNIDESRGTVEEMNRSQDHSAECTGNIDILLPEGYRSEFSTEDDKEIRGLELERVRGRGNSTWENEKKPYSVKLAKKNALLGMGKNKHWVLLADYYDNSHARNRITYRICRSLGQLYAIRCVPVEVVMNGDYYGSYLLSENVRLGEGRVDIAEMDETDDSLPEISGGYMLAMSPYADADENSLFETEHHVVFEFQTPDFVEYQNDAQKQYISGYLQKTENAIYGAGFKDADGVSYKEYMDLNAAVDYWWLQEFTRNGDAFVTDSTRLYKDRNGKLIWGPAWDFDFVAWGNLEYEEPGVEGQYAAMSYTGFNNSVMPWFDQLKLDPEFIQALKDRWPAIDAQLEAVTKEGGILDQYYEEQKASKVYDYEHWGYYTSPNTDYKSEIEQLRTWINLRRKWVNDNLDKLDNLYTTITFMADGTKIAEKTMIIGGDRKIDYPEEPQKKGFIFDGWYLADGKRLSQDVQVDGDFTVYAKYIDKNDLVRADQLFLETDEIWLPMDEDDYSLFYTTYPQEVDLVDLEWTTSNPDVAEMTTFSLLKKGVGDAVITGTLTSKNGTCTVSCLVHIYDPEQSPVKPMKDFRPAEDIVEMEIGELYQIRMVTTPKICKCGFAFFSEESDIAEVDEIGVVRAIKPGTTDILIEDNENGLTTQKKVKVIVREKKKYSNEWVKGRWYNKDGTRTYQGVGSWVKKAKGWTFVDTKGWFPKNRWQKIDGKSYFFDKNGIMESSAYRDGYYLTGSGAWDGKAAMTGWKQNARGWWYELTGKAYLKSTWKKINGCWYYFHANGYAAKNEFVSGWWIGKNYIQTDPVQYSWHKTSKGWWYGKSGGWYAKSASYVIDGTKYTFDKNGYLIEK